jgi:hypothetical protein
MARTALRSQNPCRRNKRACFYADIDLGMISVAKAAADPAGHYARPDVTRLLFNNRPANRVETLRLPVDAEPAAEASPTQQPAVVNLTAVPPSQAAE